MRLGFMYFENGNTGFKRDLVRYNTLLKNYFDNDDNTVVKKLNETFSSLLKNSSKHEILTEKESKVYNVIIDFLASNVSENDLNDINNQKYSDEIKDKMFEKLSKEMPNYEPKIMENIIEKSVRMMNSVNPQNIELVFIPSVVSGVKS